MELEITF